jgi:hypothetical protein
LNAVLQHVVDVIDVDDRDTLRTDAWLESKESCDQDVVVCNTFPWERLPYTQILHAQTQLTFVYLTRHDRRHDIREFSSKIQGRHSCNATLHYTASRGVHPACHRAGRKARACRRNGDCTCCPHDNFPHPVRQLHLFARHSRVFAWSVRVPHLMVYPPTSCSIQQSLPY